MRVLDWVYRTQASQPPILVPAGIIIVSIVVTAFFAVLPLELFMSSNFSMLSTLSIFIYTAPNIGTASQREGVLVLGSMLAKSRGAQTTCIGIVRFPQQGGGVGTIGIVRFPEHHLVCSSGPTLLLNPALTD